MPTPRQMGIELNPHRKCPTCGCLFSGEDWDRAFVVAEARSLEEAERGEAELTVMHDDCFVATWATNVQGKPLRLKRALIMGSMGGGV